MVRDSNLIDEYNGEMERIGYESKGEYGISGRRYSEKSGDNPTLHVHAYQVGSSDMKQHLAYRDDLKTHSEPAKAFGELKEQLARLFPYDIGSYIRVMEGLVLDIEQ
jgi:GrpB-like predicted nucleotidyltransferase (UPF0157 family)